MQGKVLILERRGCDFFENDHEVKELSDVGNYRVCTEDEVIKGKDGNIYFLEFTSNDAYKTRYANKRTGKPLMRPVRELIKKRALRLWTQFSNERGSFGNGKLEIDINGQNFSYTRADILKVVNMISSDEYTDIVIK